MKKIINKYFVFFKYTMSAGICFLIDILLFTLFNYMFKSIGDTSIILATVCARIISSIINYFINRNKVFNNDGKMDTMSIIKYFALAAFQMMVSSFSVMYLYKYTKINETLIKIPVEVILFMVNFFVQKFFIFNKEESKPKRNIYLFIISILTSCALSFNPIVDKLIVDFSDNFFLSTILTIVFYFFYKKYYNKTIKRKSFKIVSIFFSLLLVFGYSFNQIDSSYLAIGNILYSILSIIKFIGYYELINLVCNMIYEWFINFNIKGEIKNKLLNKYITKFKENPFKTTFILLFCIYVIYLIIFYPGVVGYDPSYQIKEFFGIPNFYSEYLNLDNSKTMITAFNPVLHTLLLGSLAKFGDLIGNVNIGIFIYTFIQMCACIAVLSYSIKVLYKEGMHIKGIIFITCIYIFVPYFPFYSICAFKDTYFTLFFMLFIIELYKILKNKMTKKNTINLILICFGMCMFRNNGLVTILMTLPFFLILKNNRKQIIISIVSICLLYFGYTTTLSLTGISGTSIREVLSVPFQQTAALINNKEDVIEEEDMKVISNILDINVIKEEYNPELSDKVKNTYNKDATTKDLIEYFNVWFKYLLREPKIYIEATINNMYGYFYPNAHNWYFYYKKYNVLNEVGINYQYNKLGVLRTILSSLGTAFAYIPLIGLFVNIGFNTWVYIYLFGLLKENKNKKYMLLLIPMITILLACIVGPVNTYFRYVLPYSSTLPFIIGVILLNKKENN